MSSVLTNSLRRACPRILLIGKNGQVGGDLYPLLTKIGEVLATDRSALDLAQSESIRECVRSFRPHIIINSAAYTAVDKAESEPDLAYAINGTAPGVLAEEALRSKALLVHYSTDYVFDGKKSAPYEESDPISPLNAYGRSKAAGEEAITGSGCAHLILRTSWVYSLRGSNFLRTILRLSQEREELRIVDDQIGAPTSSPSIADTTAQILRESLSRTSVEHNRSGIYHLTSSGQCSWYGFANAILEHAPPGGKLKRLVPIPSVEYPVPARRPPNSRLNCSKIFDVFGVRIADWRVSLSCLLEKDSVSPRE